MFEPEKLEDMTPQKKIETIEALNDIEESHNDEYKDIIDSINYSTKSLNDNILSHVATKRKILEDDIDFQEKLGDRMLNSIRKMNDLQIESTNKSTVASVMGNPITQAISSTALEYF